MVYDKNAKYFKRHMGQPPEETWGWHLLGHDPDVDPKADPHCCFKAYDLEIVVESMLETGQDMEFLGARGTDVPRLICSFVTMVRE